MKPAFEIDTCIIEGKEEEKGKELWDHYLFTCAFKKCLKNNNFLNTTVHLYRTSPVLNLNLAQLQV